ncbi:transglycosylase domain-containing protein [Blastococcus sp. TML/M2B]|uniref:biosynthetic peptidoglycan transglycosylase n=1 Tax=unclassified Blastococcus TaxID=2619396 RepID=UPI00190B31B9|nr:MULTISPECIES: biosynthetic peptidoglycan transglycosylase [unclassified Blastococcus]MBN1093758.1 transglycosylase domain-containing protein [Blastococcus sp. TML/M2B]MBN1096120.1 transglycosylase domain-containing protein [Blastococcus sp. TML/C7B]
METTTRQRSTPVPRTARWGRRARRLVVGLAVLAALLLGTAWTATPGVGDARSRVDARLAAHAGTPVEAEVPPRIAAALLATEDSHFADHIGIDWRGALRAPLGLVSGRDHGGSTLHQQLARLLYEDGATDPMAKARAVVLAVKIDRGWSNLDILRMYLDAAYFGHGFYGVGAAAEGYFGRTPAELDWAQATVLVGLVQAPSAYDPLLHPELARSRQGHVLNRLVAVGTLDRADADAIGREPWRLVEG